MPNRQLDRLMWAQAYEAMERAQRLHRQFFHRAHTTPCWEAPVDIFETEGEIVVKAELPGMDRKDIWLHLENNVLSLRGERKFEKETKDENYHRIERSYGAFNRSFSIPATVDEEKIRADYKDGVLKIVLPKKEQTKPKQIKIATE